MDARVEDVAVCGSCVEGEDAADEPARAAGASEIIIINMTNDEYILSR
jgi:hypothetical protein